VSVGYSPSTRAALLAAVGASRVPRTQFPCMRQVSRLRQADSALAYGAPRRIAFPFTQQGRHLRLVISELNTEPTVSPVNA